MNKVAAQWCRAEAKRLCTQRKIQYSKLIYRDVKALYNAIPRKRRHVLKQRGFGFA